MVGANVEIVYKVPASRQHDCINFYYNLLLISLDVGKLKKLKTSHSMYNELFALFLNVEGSIKFQS